MPERISVERDGVGVQIHTRQRAAMDLGPTSQVVVTVDDGVPVQVNGRSVTKARSLDVEGVTQYWDLSEQVDGQAGIWQFRDGTVGVDVRADLNQDAAKRLAARILVAAGVPVYTLDSFLGSIEE